MAEYIEREAVIDALQNHYEVRNAVQNGIMDECVMLMMQVPAADVVPARHGRWKKSYADHEAFGVRPFFRYCSECNEATVHQYNYCPSCGARMDMVTDCNQVKDGDANNGKNHLRPTNMSGTKCEPCKPTQPECGDCEYIKDGDGDV